MQRKLTLKATQKNPDSPPKLIRQYQVVVNVLGLPLDDWPPIRRDIHWYEVPEAGFSIVDKWMAKVKKLLKLRV